MNKTIFKKRAAALAAAVILCSAMAVAQEARTHVVQRGETLESIAESYGVTADDIIRPTPTPPSSSTSAWNCGCRKKRSVTPPKLSSKARTGRTPGLRSFPQRLRLLTIRGRNCLTRDLSCSETLQEQWR